MNEKCPLNGPSDDLCKECKYSTGWCYFNPSGKSLTDELEG